MILLVIGLVILSVILICVNVRQKRDFKDETSERARKEYERIYKGIQRDYESRVTLINNQLEHAQKVASLEKDKLLNSLEQEKRLLDTQIEQKRERLSDIDKQYAQTVSKNSEMERIGRENVEAKIQVLQTQRQHDIDEWTESMQEAASAYATLVIDEQREEIQNMMHVYNELADSAREKWEEENTKLITIQNELAQWQQKRDAINADIVRQRQIEEDSDFYRIQFTDEAREDMKVLLSIQDRLHSSSELNKVIYNCYVEKPFKEMFKRVLGKSTYSACDSEPGIYKITCVDTQEAYIGQAKNIAKRWQEHVQCAVGMGNDTSSLYRAMKAHGIDRFTFELMTYCEKEELNEMEKYYIELYNTNTVGYNERLG